jgi:hypothetical protein
VDALDALLAPTPRKKPEAVTVPDAPRFLTPMPTMAPIAPVPPSTEAAAVADDFVQLLAFEQGEHHEPPVRQLPTAPITDEMLSEIAARVPVAPPAPITDEMLSEIAARVPVAPPAPITDEMLSLIALRVIPPGPTPITDEMLSQIAGLVPVPPPPQITYDMLEDVAARVAERLHAGAVGDELREAVNAAVRSIVSETAERLVRDEIERIKSKPRP